MPAGSTRSAHFPAYGRWAEWNGKYRDGVRKFLKGEPGQVGDMAQRLQGSPDLYAGPRAHRIDQLHHRPRRLHAQRSGLLQRQAQRGQRRRQPRRRQRQRQLELRLGRTDRRSRHQRPAPAPDEERRGHAHGQPGRADDPHGRRNRAHQAWQQQHLLPGQRTELAGLGLWSERMPISSASSST